jgi:DNA mismatch repair protein MutS2
LLKQYQHFLSDIDVLQPKPNMQTVLTVFCQYHRNHETVFFETLPFISEQKNEITHPQTIELQQENRIIVISGPNAG